MAAGRSPAVAAAARLVCKKARREVAWNWWWLLEVMGQVGEVFLSEEGVGDKNGGDDSS